MNQKYKGLTRALRQSAAVVVAGCMALAAQAQTAIESVSGSVRGGTEVVRIDLSQALSAVPTGFAIQSPARIALDFPGTTNALGRSTVEINQGNLRSASVVQAGDRTRVVLNLKQPTAYKAELQGKSLLVVLDPVAAVVVPTSTAATTQFAEAKTSGIYPLKDVDFRRGNDNAGRVIVSLANNQVGVDIRKQAGSLVVEFLQSSLPEGLRRRMDVTDFATPVQLITTSQQGERVRMVIDNKGDWEHSAYQRDDQFVVEVREKKVDTSKLVDGPQFSGEKISLNFQSIEVRSLLQVIADFTNFNIVTSDTVTGALTLRLKDVPWDQALQNNMEAKGLGMRKAGSVLWIAPKYEIDARTKRDMEAALAIEKLEPLRTQAFQLNYAKADAMVTQLNGSGSSGGSGGSNNRFLSDRGSVIAEPRTNQLFVTDTAAKLAQVQELLSKLDIAVRQVLIEARIVEASDTFGRSLGIKLGGNGAWQSSSSGKGISIGSSYANSEAGAAGNPTSGTFVNFPGSNLGTGFDTGTFAVSIFNSITSRLLTLELSALEADGKGKIVSSPRIVTADQTKALIEQGTEFPYQQATSSGATSIAFRKANLKLEVTPQITPEGNIILDLDINKDSRGETTQAGIAINTKHIRTQVLVENGGTVVIGGIFELTETNDESKIPLLGNIPAVGNLFKTRTRTSNKQEMLVFITPRMVAERTATR